MKLRHALQLAIDGVEAKPSRTILTLTGIAIGIAAVITIMSMGGAAQKFILQEIEGFGAEMIAVRPGKEPTGLTDFSDSLLTESLTDRDIEALKRKENVPHLVDIAPQVIVPGTATYEGESYRPVIVGAPAEFYGVMFDLYPIEGRLFDESEIRERAPVAVLGHEVKQELFGESDAVGESISIGDKKLRVIGVYPQRGIGSLFEYDKLVITPHTTANTYLLGQSHYHEIIIRVENSDVVARSVRDVELTLMETHGLEPEDEPDFNVTTQQEAVDTIGTVISSLTIFLTGVVAVALVVGGVGIMNIMMVSVTERTREIGLRKAVGATEGDIMLQFLLEAVLVTLGGGIIGVIAGAALSYGINILINNFTTLNWEFVLPLGAVILALGVSSAIGLIFGLYPAKKASQKSPMEALRYE